MRRLSRIASLTAWVVRFHCVDHLRAAWASESIRRARSSIHPAALQGFATIK